KIGCKGSKKKLLRMDLKSDKWAAHKLKKLGKRQLNITLLKKDLVGKGMFYRSLILNELFL
ncbi:MAG: hypothetical protein Q8T08_14395, partial [Ignavibacteria bacterium]|nr:hypothetical protein [Ignavibacteria bacterium]